MKENVNFELLKLFNKPVLFACWRIKNEDVPKGLIRYELRHDDEGNLCEVKDHVLCDHFGTILCVEPIASREVDGILQTTKCGINIAPDDYNWLGDDYDIEGYQLSYEALLAAQKFSSEILDSDPVAKAAVERVRSEDKEKHAKHKKYKVAFSGFIYVTAESEGDAREVCLDGMDDCDCVYSQLQIDSVREVDEFSIPIIEDAKGE